jgi:hypothetical protein
MGSTDTGRVLVHFPHPGSGTKSEHLFRAEAREARRAPRLGFPVPSPLPDRNRIADYLARSERSIVCLLCGRELRMLAKHLPLHGMNARDYKLLYGLPLGWGLVCREASEQMALKAAGAGLIRLLSGPRPSPSRGSSGQRLSRYVVLGMQERGAARARKPKERPCEHCGTVRRFPNWRYRFCSKQCFDTYQRTGQHKRVSGWERARRKEASIREPTIDDR